MNVAIIPARGGSKRIPRKNIKLFGGRPMIEWSIDAATKSKLFDQIIVSTDDSEIAEIALACGADVPFKRPSELSDDYTNTSAVIAHAIEWYQQQGLMPRLACCIYATAPFVSPIDLKRGLDIISTENSDFAFSVTSFAFPIQRAISLTKEGRVKMFQPECFEARSQDLEEAYHDAGQFYWGKADAWLSGKPIFSIDSSPVILPRHRVQDVDTIEDWLRAEWMFNAMQAEVR
jgi:pseudaminic acid cytidylyltransferase